MRGGEGWRVMGLDWGCRGEGFWGWVNSTLLVLAGKQVVLFKFGAGEKPVTTKNKTNKTVGPKEANNSAGTQASNDAGHSEMKLNKNTLYCHYVLLILQLSRAQNQRIEADDAAKTLRKEFAQGTEDLLSQTGATRASSTNYASTPVHTASPSRVFSAGVHEEKVLEEPDNSDLEEEKHLKTFLKLVLDEEGIIDYEVLEKRILKFSIDSMLLIINVKSSLGKKGLGSGYQQKGIRKPSQIDITGMDWNRCAKSRPSQKCQCQSHTEDSAVKPEPETEEILLDAILTNLMGRG
ncbi:hypothetical protein Tco_1069220 [Tanacetum coccineum]|uniref:Uncharacterized protein n=1 Tax=Tanacetum coccineum TaxID=301880 RepID=A0ABQ5HK38_9ASTR